MSSHEPANRPAMVRLASSAVLALGLLAGVGLAGCGDGSFDVGDVAAGDDGTARPAEYSYLIPAGTGAAKDAGEPVEILPADMTVNVGEVFELINEDDRGHIVGPFYVRAGETLRQEFTSPGVFEGVCTVHPSGQITVTVVGQ